MEYTTNTYSGVQLDYKYDFNYYDYEGSALKSNLIESNSKHWINFKGNNKQAFIGFQDWYKCVLDTEVTGTFYSYFFRKSLLKKMVIAPGKTTKCQKGMLKVFSENNQIDITQAFYIQTSAVELMAFFKPNNDLEEKLFHILSRSLYKEDIYG